MEQSEYQSNYLIETPVKKLLFKFAAPCVVSMLVACLYNIVDQIFVGQGVGYLGNAATGIVFPITVAALAAALLFGDGAAALMSISRGGGDGKNSGKAAAVSLTASLVSGLAVTAVCYALGDAPYYLLGATEQTIALARGYGSIIVAGLPLYVLGNCLASVIRADGGPKYAMICVLTGAVINIILDPVAIFALGMGIEGAAFATVIGQLAAFAMAFAYLFKSKTFRVKAADFKPDLRTLKKISALGMSSFLTQFSIVVVTVVNNKLLVRYGAASDYGADIPLAAFVVIMKLFQIVLCVTIGISVGAMPVVGYNYGAKRYDRVRAAFKYVLLSTLAVGLAATLLFELAPYACVSIFGSQNARYVDFAVKCLRIYLMLIVFTCLQKSCAIFLQSLGKAKIAMPLSMLRDVVCLILFSCTLPLAAGVEGIFWAAPLADVTAAAVTLIAVLAVMKGLPKTARTDGAAVL